LGSRRERSLRGTGPNWFASVATPYFIFLRFPPVGSARSVGCALTDHGSSYLPGDQTIKLAVIEGLCSIAIFLFEVPIMQQFNLAAACHTVLEYCGMRIKAEELPLHLSRIQTSQGGWLIAVQSIAEARVGGTLLLKLILEQSKDDEHFRTRELWMQVLAVKLYDPDLFANVVSRIRQWIETTEGDGFLELSEPDQ
jgi:hypothetical protein